MAHGVVYFNILPNTHRRRDADATQLDSWVASASAVCIGHYRHLSKKVNKYNFNQRWNDNILYKFDI